MKRAILTVSIFALVAGAAFAGVTKEDLRKLIVAGVSDDVIAAFIKANGPVDPLSADDIVDLKKAGASDKVLQAILAPKAEPAPAPYAQRAPAPQPYAQPVQRETVYVDRPVYVERPSTTYYVYDYPTTTYSCYPSYPRRSVTHCDSYYSWYPSTRYYSSCGPSYGAYYTRSSRRSSFTFGIGW